MKFNELDKQLQLSSVAEKSDEERLEDIREWLQTRLRPAGLSPDGWVDTSLKYCLSLIEELKEENESLWSMLDELKSSEMESWAKDNHGMLKEYLEEHVKTLRWQNKTKGEV
ncbi:MAG TPA: hypothetical protein EYM86_03025 [Flavobacteriales bacterium]|nr:hypothetical protein [Flavobacteriales bacterium]